VAIINKDYQEDNNLTEILKTCKPDLLLISPYSKTRFLGNNIDLLKPILGYEYLKRPNGVIDDLSKGISISPEHTMKRIIQISNHSIRHTVKYSSMLKFANDELKLFLENNPFQSTQSKIEIISPKQTSN
jgi:hypothetical protein